MSILSLLLFAGGSYTFAAKPLTKAEADSAYAREDYARAAAAYEALIDQNGASVALYYNLGNAYYRQEKMAKAILNYERALILDPADRDIRFNLDMARSKTVDKIVPESEMFFVTLFRSVSLSMSVGKWAWLAIAMFVLMLAGTAVYLLVPDVRAQKLGFVVGLFALLVCVLANVAAYRQLNHMEHRTGAVIMAPSVVVKSTPSDSGTDLFILHEGTRVQVVDDSMRDWCEVRVADGKEGWMLKDKMEVI